ncbi:hypothetical protein HPB47_014497, partial [Ixodes persulcatus]
KSLCNRKKRLCRPARLLHTDQAWSYFSVAFALYKSGVEKTKVQLYQHDFAAILKSNLQKFSRIINPHYRKPVSLFNDNRIFLTDYDAVETFFDFFLP